MSPKDWGPYVWRFLHTLLANITEEGYSVLKNDLYNIVNRILVLLPCPECSDESVTFFRGVSIQNIPTKTSFCNILYLLHNRVNAKLKKPLFNSVYISIYDNKNIIEAYNNFIKVFSTTSARLMNDNMHRRLFIIQLSKWITTNIQFFIPEKIQSVPIPTPKSIEVLTQIPVVNTPSLQKPLLNMVSNISKKVIFKEPINGDPINGDPINGDPIIDLIPEPSSPVVDIDINGDPIIDLIPAPSSPVVDINGDPIIDLIPEPSSPVVDIDIYGEPIIDLIPPPSSPVVDIDIEPKIEYTTNQVIAPKRRGRKKKNTDM